jgi:hypothetical protein
MALHHPIFASQPQEFDRLKKKGPTHSAFSMLWFTWHLGLPEVIFLCEARMIDVVWMHPSIGAVASNLSAPAYHQTVYIGG